MRKNRSGIWLCFTLLATLNSCGVHYATVAPSAPLLKSSGDIAVNANVSTATGWAGSISYAVLDQLSLMVEGSLLGGDSDSVNHMSQHYRSFGAGLGTQVRDAESLHADLFFGYARGTSLFDGHSGAIGTGADSGKASFTSYFAQSAIALGIDQDDATDVIGYQLRLSCLTFVDYFSLLQYRNGDTNDREIFIGHSDVLMSEHSFIIRVGPPSVKMTGFITFPLMLHGASEDLFTTGGFGLGLEFRHNFFGAP